MAALKREIQQDEAEIRALKKSEKGMNTADKAKTDRVIKEAEKSLKADQKKLAELQRK